MCRDADGIPQPHGAACSTHFPVLAVLIFGFESVPTVNRRSHGGYPHLGERVDVVISLYLLLFAFSKSLTKTVVFCFRFQVYV
jgi:hypothetical protein